MAPLLMGILLLLNEHRAGHSRSSDDTIWTVQPYRGGNGGIRSLSLCGRRGRRGQSSRGKSRRNTQVSGNGVRARCTEKSGAILNDSRYEVSTHATVSRWDDLCYCSRDAAGPCAFCSDVWKSNRDLRNTLLYYLACQRKAIDCWADDVGVGDGSSFDEMEWQREHTTLVSVVPREHRLSSLRQILAEKEKTSADQVGYVSNSPFLMEGFGIRRSVGSPQEDAGSGARSDEQARSSMLPSQLMTVDLTAGSESPFGSTIPPLSSVIENIPSPLADPRRQLRQASCNTSFNLTPETTSPVRSRILGYADLAYMGCGEIPTQCRIPNPSYGYASSEYHP